MKMIPILVGVLVALVAMPALSQQRQPSTRMYKCVDEAGKVFYSDSPRADCNNGTQMNRQGVVVTNKSEKGAKSAPTQLVKKSEPATGERRDRALMATYMAESEIDAARDRSLEMPQQAIKSLEVKIDKTATDLFELKNQADALASKQKTLPPDLIEDVQLKQKQQAALESELVKKKAEADAITARYEADKARYRELKGPPPATASAKN